MKFFNTVFVLPLVAVFSTPVMAHVDHSGYSKLDNRIERQYNRINKVVRMGELTKKEAQKLRKQHRQIKKLSRQFNKGGHLSRFERKILKRELNLASHRIYDLKHNDRNRSKRLYDSWNPTKKYSNHFKRTRFDDQDRITRKYYRNHF
jgi:hypothetical protein